MSHTTPERLNFAASILSLNVERGSKVAYIDDEHETTYGELAMRVKRFARLLGELGVHREQRIFVAILDSADLPTVFFGAPYAGVVPVTVNTLLPPSEWAFMLEHSDAKIIFTSGPLIEKFREAAGSLRVVVSRPTVRDHGDFESLVLGVTPLEIHANTYFDDFAFWHYSSGSTGKPKGRGRLPHPRGPQGHRVLRRPYPVGFDARLAKATVAKRSGPAHCNLGLRSTPTTVRRTLHLAL